MNAEDMTSQNAQEIVHRMACYDFPWDMTRALELALFRTYCSPRISGLLAATGEFERCPQKRYDDTDIIVSELMEWGYDSVRGAAALARMNAIHGRFKIANDEFLYVLSTFVFEPIRWIERFGWRAPSEAEKQALFLFWREVGMRMAIRDIPQERAAFEAFSRDYERRNFGYSDSNRRIGVATRELFVAWFPRVLGPLVRRAIYALIDAPLREAFGFPAPSRLDVALVTGALRLRARLLRLLPARRTPRLRTAMRRPSYPGGYRIEDVGPAHACPHARHSAD
jgi:hypothetical protein